MNNIEELMQELMRSSVLLKRGLYRRDEAASTMPEGTEGATILVHTCMVCERSAAGEGAQVRHKAACALARLQRAQAALRAASPELFAPRGAAAPPQMIPVNADAPDPRRSHPVPVANTNDRPPASAAPPQPDPPQPTLRQRGRRAQLGAVHQRGAVPAAPVYVPPSQVRHAPDRAQG